MVEIVICKAKFGYLKTLMGFDLRFSIQQMRIIVARSVCFSNVNCRLQIQNSAFIILKYVKSNNPIVPFCKMRQNFDILNKNTRSWISREF